MAARKKAPLCKGSCRALARLRDCRSWLRWAAIATPPSPPTAEPPPLTQGRHWYGGGLKGAEQKPSPLRGRWPGGPDEVAFPGGHTGAAPTAYRQTAINVVGATLVVARKKTHLNPPVILNRSAVKNPVNRRFQCHRTGSFAYTLPQMPFAGLLRDSPQSGAAAEIAVRLPMPPAAAACNSLRMTRLIGRILCGRPHMGRPVSVIRGTFAKAGLFSTAAE